MSAVMGRPCLSPPDGARAAADVAYFDEQIGHFGDRAAARRAFIDAVIAAWNEAHPDARRRVRDDEPAPAPALTYVERRVLVFAAEKLPRFRTRGGAEQVIRWEFGFSATRYYQVLNSLIDRPEALALAPGVVNRLQARRTAARGRRTNRARPAAASSVGRAA